MNQRWQNVSFILLIATGLRKDGCLGAKLERKQDFFEVGSFDNKREYGLSEIEKRGFSTLGFDYSSPSPAEYGLGGGGTSSVVGSDYRSVRAFSGGGAFGEDVTSSSPSRDLIPPPPPPGVFTSAPSTSRSEYSNFGRISSSPSTKDFLSSRHHHYHPSSPNYTQRRQISRRSPHLHNHYQHPHAHQSPSLSHYYDDLEGDGGGIGNRGERGSSTTNPVNFGLVADNDGKLIGYRGSILPGYHESHASSPSSGYNPDATNFIGGYFPGTTSSFTRSSPPEYEKHKYRSSSLSPSASSGRYTSTPVYYPGLEEDHTYRMRDTTSQGYDEDEQSPPLVEDSDFTAGGSGTYQPSPVPRPPPPLPPHHYHHHLRENDGILGHNNILEGNSLLPYGRDYSPTTTPTGFSYGPLGKSHRFSYDYNTAKQQRDGSDAGPYKHVPAPNSPPSYDIPPANSIEHEGGRPTSPYSYLGLGYNEYDSR